MTFFQKLKEELKPELLNRLDHTIVFDALSEKDIKKIVRLELKKLKKRIQEQGHQLTYSPQSVSVIAKRAISLGQGARYVQKSIQDLVENEVARAIINEKVKDGKIELKVENEKIIAI